MGAVRAFNIQRYTYINSVAVCRDTANHFGHGLQNCRVTEKHINAIAPNTNAI